MAKNKRQPNETAAGTNIKKVQKQNQNAAQENQFAEEFASETDAQEVRRRNKQSEQKK
ncbi:gamma-type small acid-soluble spore protein [Allobacillus sp. SKP2-8]|uniref:gamma-type small acid-soluble spore protein n=1 Tax=unclassified Allobacillus TaxID=2628859 RepID=UPI0011831FA9|nr:gamma-type small acid-soluble spore protein [Allobacillus sp. SKP2-8]TSJ66952.1 gamma-type small acid-soluble spore protein [Allobacillus sp. SKP2-8]